MFLLYFLLPPIFPLNGPPSFTCFRPPSLVLPSSSSFFVRSSPSLTHRGGVAGLALAARLSEWSNTTVLVIEAGGDGTDVQDQVSRSRNQARRERREIGRVSASTSPWLLSFWQRARKLMDLLHLPMLADRYRWVLL